MHPASVQLAPVAGPSVNALSVDVEEYFQVAAFERTIPRERWDTAESRVEYSTHKVLDVFDAHGVNGTFFVLGWIAERHPALVQRIVRDGHELASHGYDHTRVHQFEPAQFRADVVRTKAILEDIGGIGVRGRQSGSLACARGDGPERRACGQLATVQRRPVHDRGRGASGSRRGRGGRRAAAQSREIGPGVVLDLIFFG